MQEVWAKTIRRWVGNMALGLVLLGGGNLQASHIIGGDVSMQAVGTTPGLFRVQLTQYWDATKIGTGNQDPSVTLLIFRKNNPVLIEQLTIRLQETLPLTFNNAACASLAQLSFVQARYYTTYQFDPSRYTDPGGYYMVWERCCRNDALTNVNTSVASGVAMTFYLEFPAMQKNGVTFIDSSPNFTLPNGAYICVNKPFTFDLSATDADGDKLVYSLVTPLNGYTTKDLPTLSDISPRSSYPTINWAPGYSLTNIIPGKPPLSINASTGELSVTATQQGLYLFCVQCAEYRNGVLIGIVRRDFQLPVIDCAKTPTPAAVVMYNGSSATSITWCGSQPLVLSVEKNAAWAYQWQKDGSNIRGSTSDTLQVRSPGVYTVVKSQAKACARDTTSQDVTVTYVDPPAVKLTIATPKPYCTGDTLLLQATGQSDYQYHWQFNGKTLTGQQQATLKAPQSGEYAVFARGSTDVCDGSDSIQVTINPIPTASIQLSAHAFCANDSVTLTAAGQTGYSYRWIMNNRTLTDTAARLIVKQSGLYGLVVTTPAGCTATAQPVQATRYERPVVTLDSIAPICLSKSTILTLQGKPAGGTFSGPGIEGVQFNPASLGVGTYKLTYTVVTDTVCQTQQSRYVQVLPDPQLSGKTIYYLAKGNSVQLVTETNTPIVQYEWSPAGTLSLANLASPTATPAETTPYTVTAISTDGCSTTLTILVEVSTPLYIPSSFSPNADGMNDVWILPNIGTFPECEVSIFNRWGTLIFYSKGYGQPWDGTYQHQRVEAGVYTYQIKTGNDPLAVTYRGQLVLIR